ncbi:RluA family pseudouridine synthase [Ferrimicrobium acidiphilum]|uniref:RluA family pseudouridine synthase n=2 Tax=Ferrimicrobium acidiphilum TaxID=121039 RepID=UPI0023F33F8D|nr:RluA family pseudouridine synthase [Ferrimicrobium acidiphilum]MCL5052761.1 RluA family pseudouridine synthase [Gammaproteobacteria bacterium]
MDGMNVLSIEVGDTLAGERLDRAVSVVADVSRSIAGRMIDQRLVKVNDRVLTAKSHRLLLADQLVIDLTRVGRGPQAAIALPLLYFDEAMFVVDKPAGLIVHSTTLTDTIPTLAGAVVALDPAVALVGDEPALRPGIYQRLDKSTSGVMGVARTQIAFHALKEQVGAHLMRRRYRALVEGDLEEEEGVIDAPLGRDQRSRTRIAVIAEGRRAVTRFQVIERFGAYTYVELSLETGRTHQIRVHMSAIGHPLVGDPTYGGSSALLRERVFLHSYLLSLVHPINGRPLEVRSPLPVELIEILDGLRLSRDRSALESSPPEP